MGSGNVHQQQPEKTTRDLLAKQETCRRFLGYDKLRTKHTLIK